MLEQGLEYGRRGLVGVLTPQSNTTVEAEFWTMAPPGVNLINARLVSAETALNDRLVDYVKRLEATLDHFENAPLTAVAFACTGSSYLVGPVDEAKIVSDLKAKRQLPIITAARAITAALSALDARRITLISPYPADLTAKSAEYWCASGLEVSEILHVAAPQSAAFHPIYSVSGEAVSQAVSQVKRSSDAILLLGTGMPTLGAILRHRALGIPVISSMLCLGWLAIAYASGTTTDKEGLLAWCGGGDWSQTFYRRYGDPASV